jgi:hypothetical protein
MLPTTSKDGGVRRATPTATVDGSPRFAEMLNHEVYHSMLSLERMYPSVRKINEEGQLLKRRRVPAYLRSDQPRSKFIVRSEALCSGWGRNKIVKPADQILQELERHRIEKIPRRPKRPKRRRRRGKKGAQKHRVKTVYVPKRHRTLMKQLALGDGSKVATVDKFSGLRGGQSAIEPTAPPNGTVDTTLRGSASIVEFSLTTKPEPSANKQAGYMATPVSHCAKHLEEPNAVSISSTEKEVLQLHAKKSIVVGSPWSSLPVSIENKVKQKQSHFKVVNRRSTTRKQSQNAPMENLQNERYTSKMERLQAGIEMHLHGILSNIEENSTDARSSRSFVSSSKKILMNHVAHLAKNMGDGKSTVTKIRDLAHDAVCIEKELQERKIKLAANDFVEKNRQHESLAAQSPQKVMDKIHQLKVKRNGKIRRALEFRKTVDQSWAEGIQKKNEERMFRIRAGRREQEKKRFTTEWLQIVSLMSRARYQYFLILAKNKTLWAVKVLQRCWRNYRLKGKGEKYWKTMWKIKRWMKPLLARFRERIRIRSADTLKLFLNHHKDADVVITSIKKFRYKIVRSQRKFRAYSAITKCRLQLLTKLWTRTEADLHANQVQHIKKKLQKKQRLKISKAYTKTERKERSKQAIQLATNKGGNIMRIEKHLIAMENAQDAYHSHLVKRPTKSAFPKYVVQRALIEYLRKRRIQHGIAFMEMRQAKLDREEGVADVHNTTSVFDEGTKVGFTVADVQKILDMTHIEEHDGKLSELELSNKKTQARQHLRRLMRHSNNNKWPELHLLQGNNYGGRIGKVRGAIEDMPLIINGARKKYQKILHDKRKKALEKKKKKEAQKSTKMANILKNEALQRDYFVAMQILGGLGE